MKIKVQLVVCDDEGHEETFTDVVVLEKGCARIEPLCLPLADAKQLLTSLQPHLVAQQATTVVATRAHWADCGATLPSNGHHTRTFRTLCGTVTLTRPRFSHGRCQRPKTTTVRPLTALGPDAGAPERRCMETTWASLVSYGLTAQARKDFRPIDAPVHATTIQTHALAVARRCTEELGEEPWACVEGCQRDGECLPSPDGPITVGIDGGDVRDWAEQKRRFEVMVGKSPRACKRDDEADTPSNKGFGVVQSYETKPQRRLFEVLQSQGHQMH